MATQGPGNALATNEVKTVALTRLEELELTPTLIDVTNAGPIARTITISLVPKGTQRGTPLIFTEATPTTEVDSKVKDCLLYTSPSPRDS